MTKTVYLIVPAWSDQAGQCRIVSRVVAKDMQIDALDSYRSNHKLWAEAGIMNSRGHVVCLNDPVALADMRNCEPLMAGTQFSYPVEQPSTHYENALVERPRL